ncbi:NAD(P)-dependent alcohol dehydrogenase [Kutzneria sp. CA-103260]|uniref:NAD(P)-dependent alcohol dehydrogenase n=1 Tax=Kutzneria sp. CA-103260 TaxID=2802641 RepID=UPI001BA6CF98|nr:NAD(P)-dependent alcohol dehydrogenase [Kutzneria sp. CA-103260]QUQ68798.1 Zn-dependent alcohol dehydrogenase class III [Kutzneria sp. CA-103260]
MPHVVTAAVARRGRSDFTVETLHLADPRPDELLIRFTASGLCHTDLEVAAGRLPTPLPVVAGHEGVGVVEAVGSQVSGVAPGTRVVLSVDSCGVCSSCVDGQPAYCADHAALNFAAQRADGSTGLTDASGAPVHDHFFGQSSFANYGLAHRQGLVAVDDDIPDEVLAPLGCGVLTGAGAVWNSLRVNAGSTVAVLGTGTVGMSAVLAAAVAGAGRIIAVDRHPHRLELASALGATDVVNAAETTTDDAIMTLTGGTGVDYSVESTGDATAMSTAIAVLAARGTASILGVAGQDASVRANAFDLLRGRTIAGSVMGHQAPAALIPRIIAQYRRGRFPLDRLVRTYPLAKINDAVADARAGVTVKAVLLHDSA